ncbi:tyrosine-protein phosphatase [Catenovulum adriaticum]|uniref:protein-tyrosine-phosphatase n=1 Tax=Catenovulum adriaticum TaxID=2984846 RepID=A0ABY7ANZ3_9ALTE|nr:CpsB/CapC family capsule biosynthesis tyrosine phosphatase [Catenovulum sp. TS8]WAJ70982.1 tyrosine protein phosphatase [Catenovulum sp. TS8]
MIDIHSHILPNVDDGARSLNESMDMLKMAEQNGVTTQVLTPHIHLGRYDNNQADLAKRFINFNEVVEQSDLNIKLLLACELRISSNIIQLVKQQNLPILGEMEGFKLFLLEFPRIELPAGYLNLIQWLLSKQYRPIIVHPERNKTFVRQPEKLQALLKLGCLTQITASSLTGKFGQSAQQNAQSLLLNNQVSTIASDCHNLKGRQPDLKQGIDKAAELIGQQAALKLVTTQAEQLIYKNPFTEICMA